MKNTNLFELSNGSVYYSGVMPRVKRIDILQTFYNPLIQTIELTVERTTLDAFDYNDIIQHPLLKIEYKKLAKFAQYEDCAQEVLFKEENIESNEKMIEAVNDFLGHSFNTHTVAVSGNIVTADDYLIAASEKK